MLPNSWCKNLSNTVKLIPRWDNAIGYQPCCWMQDTIPISTKQELTQARHQFEELVMSDKEKYCSECIRRESIGNSMSHRQQAMARVPNNAQHGDVNVLDLQYDTTCNAACVICGPHFSSLWRKKSNMTEIHEYPELDDLIDRDKITFIKLLGGEPMLSRSYRDLLDSVSTPENVAVSYTTNGSVLPDADLLQIWSRYRRVSLTFSIDDIHNRFGYVRWPLRWNKVDMNFRYLLNNLNNGKIGINCTVNAMSVYYIDQLQDWINQCGDPEVKFSKCFGVWDLSACPDGVRSHIYKKLGPDHEVSIMLAQEPWNQSRTQELINHMDQLDSQRGTNWRETFAEIQQYF